MPSLKITKSQVDRLGEGEAGLMFWDAELRGFGLKVLAGGGKTYLAQFRTVRGRSGKTTRVTIGRHGAPWTADMARDEARRILSRVALGENPAELEQASRRVLTVAQLCDRYVREGLGTKKASTQLTDRGRIERHIKPLIGDLRIDAVTSADIRKFLRDVAVGKTKVDVKTDQRGGRAIVRGGKGTASRTVGLLGGIFSYAVQARLLESSPVRGVARFPDRRNVRFLNRDELGKLGRALVDVEAAGGSTKAITIIRLLLLTGARRGEIETVKVAEVDLDSRALRLADSKTGQKIILLNAAAMSVVASALGFSPKTRTYLFQSDRDETAYAGTPKVWNKVRAAAGFANLRLHDLRHSFASLGVLSGTPIAIVGSLLGHADVATTQRYTHLSEDPVRAATEMIGQKLSDALEPTGAALNAGLEPPPPTGP